MFSPIEIRKQEFSRSMRGYDRVEVRSFLDTLAAAYEKLTETATAQQSEIERLKTELSTFQRIEQNMKEALVNAQETLRGAREGSRREADLLIREAELEAERIIRDAHKQGSAIRREIELLNSRKDGFVRKLRSLLHSELELIEMLEDHDFSGEMVAADNANQE